MNRPTSDHRGFTIIEMLVVIGVITLLLALLLPALSSVQNRARKSTEISYLRQVHIAWMTYANDNDDAAVPGYLDDDVQQRWRIRINFPYDPEDVDIDGPSDPGDPGTGSLPGRHGPIARQGDPSGEYEEVDETGATWTWRLLHYLDHAFESVLLYDDDSVRTTRQLVVRRQFAARHPAFGYNGLYIGGRWHMVDGRPQYYFSGARVSDPDSASEARVNVVSRSVSQIRRSSEVVIFCSSMRIPSPRTVQRINDIDPGYHMVTPPIVADELQWGHPTDSPGGGGGGGGGGDGTGTGSASTMAQGPGGAGLPDLATGGDPRYLRTFATPALVPIGRYNRFVPLLRADGSTETQAPAALVDQSLWIDVANSRNFSHTRNSDEDYFARFPRP